MQWLMSRLRQRKSGSKWGAIKLTYQQSLTYMTFWNFTMLTVTAYNTTIKQWFQGHGIDLEIWHMVAFVVCLLFIVMIIEYRYTQPSIYHFTWDQGYRHSTLLPGQISEIQVKLDRIIKRLNELEGKENE